MTDDVCAALDRARVSNRNGAYISAAICQALQHNVHDIACNAESIRQARLEYRERISTDIKKSFNPDALLTVHWDGKILPILMSNNQWIA